MKYLVILLVFLGIKTLKAQIIKDTIYIKFNTLHDHIKKVDSNTYFYLKNELYEKEKAKYESGINKIDKDSLYPPNFHYPIKPSKYYDFYLIEHNKNCCDSLKIEDLQFFNRKKLKSLNPYKKSIFIIKIENECIKCYLVSTFQNQSE